MPLSEEFHQEVIELLTPHTTIRTKKMFGGVGVYGNEAMFAMISSDNVLYFKVDDSNLEDYVSQDMEQFMSMPYYRVPQPILDNPDDLQEWVDKSVAIGERTKKPKKKKK